MLQHLAPADNPIRNMWGRKACPFCIPMSVDLARLSYYYGNTTKGCRHGQ
jgi:hypothetical protein